MIETKETTKKIGVLGSGSFGTAVAVHQACGDHRVMLWARDAALATRMQRDRVNEAYLPGIELPDRLEATSDIAALNDCDTILAMVPSHGYRAVLRRFLGQLPADRVPVIVSGIKGIETDTLARISEVTLEEAVRADRKVQFATLAGPSFAAELAAGAPTAAVIAAKDANLSEQLRDTLAAPSFRLYSTTDVVGVEIGGTAKNVVAIAAGVVAGLELGSNTTAVLLTRGLHEITRLTVACGGRSRTMAGLAGMGDLVLTCTGGLSRNRQLGVELAQGKTLEEISGATSMVAEGVRNSQAIARLAKRLRVEMPITEQVVAVLYEGKSPRAAIGNLMTRELKAEAEL